MLDIFQQFTFVIKQKEQYIDLRIVITQIDVIGERNKQIMNVNKKKSANN